MRSKWWMVGGAVALGVLTSSAGAGKPTPSKLDCRAVVFEGQVQAGQAFRKEFAPGLEFFLEPLRSGWIVRVLEMRNGREVRGPHDWAEVATPPYRSVSPLLISTDWAFRSQDAISWNPREFRYVPDAKAFSQMSGLVDRVAANDAAASSRVAMLVAGLPEGQLQILDAALVPGTKDQALMAASVASHFFATPHSVVQGEQPSALGRIAGLKFRVTMDLPRGTNPEPGVVLQRFSCKLRPTG